MRILCLLLLMIVLQGASLAHDGVDHADEEEAIVHEDGVYTSINPYGYFAEGRWVAGTIAVMLWLLVMKGLYDLTMLIVGRVVVH